jgi:hypothetical protein
MCFSGLGRFFSNGKVHSRFLRVIHNRDILQLSIIIALIDNILVSQSGKKNHPFK